jgi:cysteine sulfinate desulfinase/cysteine desulfurase-like protein
MGIAPELARGAIRISLGAATTETDVDRLLQVWQKLAQSLSMGDKRGQESSRFAA